MKQLWRYQLKIYMSVNKKFQIACESLMKSWVCCKNLYILSFNLFEELVLTGHRLWKENLQHWSLQQSGEIEFCRTRHEILVESFHWTSPIFGPAKRSHMKMQYLESTIKRYINNWKEEKIADFKPIFVSGKIILLNNAIFTN